MDLEDYRPNVGIVLRNPQGFIFMGKRLEQDLPYPWQMPQGGIDADETPEGAAFRELREETGIIRVQLINQSPDWYLYDLPPHMRPHFWQGRYIGQRQKWFLMDFIGTEGEIDLHTDHQEFSQWQWVEPHQLIQLVVPFKRVVYEQVLDTFGLI